MSVDALIFWLFVAAWIVVIGLLVFVQLPRIFGEVKRGVVHVLAMVNGSPLPLLLAKAETDVSRIEAALDRVPVLTARANAAVRAIRATPVIPPNVSALVRRMRLEIGAFRRSAR